MEIEEQMDKTIKRQWHRYMQRLHRTFAISGSNDDVPVHDNITGTHEGDKHILVFVDRNAHGIVEVLGGML